VISLFTLGERERLDEGSLQLWIAEGVLPTAWEERVSRRLELELPDAHVRAALDGEPVLLETPLDVESLPGALRVLVPRQSQGEQMHDQPQPTEQEQEEAHEGRQQEEESMRYPGHDDPDEQQRRAHDDGEG
jgi:hypothetical protein